MVELVAMFRPMASWQLLLVVALLDVGFILMHLLNPTPSSFTPLFLHQPPPAPSRAEHERLLAGMAAERRKLAVEMSNTLHELQDATRSLRQRTHLLASLNASLTSLEAALARLDSDRPQVRQSLPSHRHRFTQYGGRLVPPG